MTEMTQYLVLLAVSVALTFIVGRLLIRAGEPFLQEVFHDEKVTRSVNLLLSVLFHLVTLGVLAIISVTDVPAGNAVQSFVVKLGVVLLTLGIAYGVSMLVLIRVRERRRANEISEQVQERLADRGIGEQGHQ
jgi:protein-S-isoprenylcysteine O-methyltransferase Ste14